jgi:tripartite-type tricarboxylate transporter receptor subunit TctC
MSNVRQTRWKLVISLLVLTPLINVPGLLVAEDYPSRPITLTIASGVGGNIDISGRLLASKTEKLLGQPMIIASNGGGGGSVVMGALAKAKADGYQLAIGPQAPLVEQMHLRNMPFKVSDLVPIMQYAEPEAGLVVRADAPFHTFKELVEYARKNPGKVTYTIGSTLNPMHLAMMHVGKREGINWTAIPVPGGDPNMPVLGGHVTGLSSTTSWKRHVDAGKMKLLVTYGERRMSAFPNIPTLKELGYDFVAESFFLLVGPSGIPAPIISKLEDVFKKATEDPEFIAFAKKVEMPVVYRNSAGTKKHIEDANRRMEKMVVELKLPKEQ